MKPHYLLYLYCVVIVKTIKLEEVDKPRLIYCSLVQVRILTSSKLSLYQLFATEVTQQLV